MQSIRILGVEINNINLDQSIELIDHWLKDKKKHYIVTPNIEFIMAAQNDVAFKNILNKADLRLPDSARLGWTHQLLQESSLFLKVLHTPLLLFPKLAFLKEFPTTTGTDLMTELIEDSSEKGFTIGLLGGKNQVAEKLQECLLKTYPSLKIKYVNSGVKVDLEGNVMGSIEQVFKAKSKNGQLRMDNGQLRKSDQNSSENNFKNQVFLNIPPLDILFVALGQIKQEKWISKNLDKQPVKVMMGVGGAFDYLSGEVPRAPKLLRNLGFEWLFRLIIQPWRIKRFISLIRFIFAVLLKKG